MNDRPILITGAARSGTSFTAGIVHYSGGFGGDVTGPTRYNQKGQFENDAIRETLKKPLLRSLGVDPKGQHPLPPRHQSFTIERAFQWRREVMAVMVRQGWDGQTPWYYKGAKACLVWQLWHKAFPQARWIVVRRDPKSIASSCLNTGFMNAFKDEQGWLSWVEMHEQRFRDMVEADLDVSEVWPEKALITGDLSDYRTLVGNLGLQWDDVAIRAFVDPKLWHYNGGTTDGS